MFVITNKGRIMINAGVNVKNWSIMVYAIKDFRNPSNCECQCDKSCGASEYLDCESCRCRKKLVDRLAEECTENVEEEKLAEITLAEDENKHKCSSYILYNVLFSLTFIINVGIGTYFIYYKHMNCDKKADAKESLIRNLKTFMAPFYRWDPIVSRLNPLRGDGLVRTTKFPEIPGTHFIDLGRMRGWVNLGATQWFWTRDLWIKNPAP